MEDMIKKSEKKQYATRKSLANRVKELWGINEGIVELESSDVYRTTEHTIDLKEEDKIRIDNFFCKRKQNVKLNAINGIPTNLAVYLSYVYPTPVTSKSSTLKSIIDEDYELNTLEPIRITLQPVQSQDEEKIVNRLISEVKSQFPIEGNKIKLSDLQTFLNHRVIPMLESNKLDNTFVF